MTLLFRKSLERRTVFGFVVWFKTAEADIVHLQGYRTHKSTTIFLVCSQLLQKTFIFFYDTDLNVAALCAEKQLHEEFPNLSCHFCWPCAQIYSGC